MANEANVGQKTDTRFSYKTMESAMGNTGKMPPQALGFERAVLGALMIDRDSITNVVDTLRPEMFYREQHQAIYEAIFTLFRKDEPIDLLTVSDQLRSEKKLEFVGGSSYLAGLTNSVASAANVEYHARVVMERYVLRQLITICGDITKQAFDEPKDVMSVLDKAETELFNVIENNFSRESKELSAVVRKAVDDLEKLLKSDNKFKGVPTGIRKLDEFIGGWQNSDLIIIAARPGMGKTSFVLSIARNAAIDFGKSVALFSLEMSATQLVHRLFSIESGVDSEKIVKGNMNDAEWNQLMDKIQILNSNRLIIDDTPQLSIFDLRAKCRRLKHRYNIDMVIVDYLQLMQGNSDERGRNGNREQEISQISRSLKALAKDLDIPVIALSQLSRQVEQRGGEKRPMLSDLRESGSIEQDADQVMFIYRPEYYKIENFPDGTPAANRAEIIIEKNRHGGTGDVRVRFEKRYTKFCDDVDIDDGMGAASAGLAPNNQFVTFESNATQDMNGSPDSNEMPF